MAVDVLETFKLGKQSWMYLIKRSYIGHKWDRIKQRVQPAGLRTWRLRGAQGLSLVTFLSQSNVFALFAVEYVSRVRVEAVTSVTWMTNFWSFSPDKQELACL